MAQEGSENAVAVNNAEKIIDKTLDTLESGNAGGFFANLWNDYNDEIIHFGKIVLLSLLVILLAWIFSRITCRIIKRLSGKVKIDADVASLEHLGTVTARLFIWLFALLIVLDLFGINTASILTVLGAVGLAVALAMKDSMSNVAAGVMLLILRPYKTGDFVECGTVTGTIKTMGLFSTEVMTFEGIFVAVPNSIIFAAPVKNYSRNDMRRAVISVGVSYSDDIEKGTAALLKMLAENELVLNDPISEVSVEDLADNSVNLTVRFWATTANYWKAYWQVKAAIKPTLENAGLNIPFPQRVITFANALPENRKAE